MFDRSVNGHEASRKLAALRQCRRTTTDYAIEFRTLAATCEWNEPALTAHFLDGLNGEIKEEILARDLPSCLDQMVELPSTSTSARGPVPEQWAVQSVVTPLSMTSSEPEPMQLGGIHISAAECQCHIQEGLCMYSGVRRYFAMRCPVKERARQ